MRAKGKNFTATYKVDDGYVGNRPRSFVICQNYIEDDMDEIALEAFYDEQVQEDFEQCVHPHGTNRDAFVEWAKQVIAETREP
jgi:hypothetical protein